MEASDREGVPWDSGGGAGQGRAGRGGAGTAVLEEPSAPPAEAPAPTQERPSRLPHLWSERPWPARIVVATVPAAAFGALCGWALGVNKALYIVLAIPLAVLGGFLAGLEHRGRDAWLRGAVGGATFGAAILGAHHLIGSPYKFHLKDPKWQLIVVTAVAGAVLGRLGAGQRLQLEKEGPYLDLRRVSRGELVGMASGLILLGSLWLPWFATSSSNPHSRINSAGIGPGQTASAWQTFHILDVLLCLAVLAPFILTWIIARGHALAWRPGELTAIAGITAFILILCNGIILGKPKPSIAISLDVGYFVGLVAAAGLVAAGYLRQARYGDNKPPGVL